MGPGGTASVGLVIQVRPKETRASLRPFASEIGVSSPQVRSGSASSSSFPNTLHATASHSWIPGRLSETTSKNSPRLPPTGQTSYTSITQASSWPRQRARKQSGLRKLCPHRQGLPALPLPVPLPKAPRPFTALPSQAGAPSRIPLLVCFWDASRPLRASTARFKVAAVC